MKKVEPIRTVNLIQDMINAFDNPRDRFMFIIGINMGLRISDILTLKYGDLRDKDFLYLVEQKTINRTKQKIRKIKINDAIKAELAQFKDRPNDEYIFLSRQKVNGEQKPIDRVRAWQILKKTAKKIGLSLDDNESIGSHSLRKTFGLHAYLAGTDITVLMKTFNHSSAAETLSYIGITDKDIEAVYDKLGDIFTENAKRA